jgi:hypothetical protein
MECVLFEDFNLLLNGTSSEDSLNATIQESEGYYDTAISSNVSTLLALNHETVGKDHPAPCLGIGELRIFALQKPQRKLHFVRYQTSLIFPPARFS